MWKRVFLHLFCVHGVIVLAITVWHRRRIYLWVSFSVTGNIGRRFPAHFRRVWDGSAVKLHSRLELLCAAILNFAFSSVYICCPYLTRVAVGAISRRSLMMASTMWAIVFVESRIFLTVRLIDASKTADKRLMTATCRTVTVCTTRFDRSLFEVDQDSIARSRTGIW